ncbi:hypothetical protein VNI00_011145 [Paramarasmius palmivorus]|uniref:Microbial-type PARG catalytic domain-containing protein n=1 Tax=Paramarasmius palmivorus TaxID=297713 RepID=A0AAW0CD45_9AGAR
MTPSLAERRQIAEDTQAHSDLVTVEHALQGATLKAFFTKDQLPALDPSSCPRYPSSPVDLVTSDTFAATRDLIERYPDAANGKVAVLNLASDELPGGGWNKVFCLTQEDSLCYSSTLFKTLDPSYYPWPNLGPGSIAGIFSPGVVIFKDELDNKCVNLKFDDRHVVGIISVAAPRCPSLTSDGRGFANESDLNDLRGKIRLIYRMAARNGREYLVLGAMGCGAYRCPPGVIAKEMKSVLLEPEFKGWFRNITFAIHSNRAGKFDVFKTAFQGVVV